MRIDTEVINRAKIGDPLNRKETIHEDIQAWRQTNMPLTRQNETRDGRPLQGRPIIVTMDNPGCKICGAVCPWWLLLSQNLSKFECDMKNSQTRKSLQVYGYGWEPPQRLYQLRYQIDRLQKTRAHGIAKLANCLKQSPAIRCVQTNCATNPATPSHPFLGSTF